MESRKKIGAPDAIPTHRDLVGCSNHWATGDSMACKAETWVFYSSAASHFSNKQILTYLLARPHKAFQSQCYSNNIKRRKLKQKIIN